jgi:hypothetical protein
MGDVSEEPRPGNIGVRLLCDGDGHVSHAIRFGRYRAWHAAAEARECDNGLQEPLMIEWE